MNGIFYVILGGALGAAARHGISLWALQGPRIAVLGGVLPLATLACNVIGGFLMGVLWATLDRHSAILGIAADDARLFLGVGLLGGFTTFSAFSLESWQMIAAQQFGLFLLYAALSFAGSIAALAAGLLLTQRMMGQA
jgi:fluoride exporter